eukprot:scaffold11342_cov114-Isochrysis_galbana.AAC.4
MTYSHRSSSSSLSDSVMAITEPPRARTWVRGYRQALGRRGARDEAERGSSGDCACKGPGQASGGVLGGSQEPHRAEEREGQRASLHPWMPVTTLVGGPRQRWGVAPPRCWRRVSGSLGQSVAR